MTPDYCRRGLRYWLYQFTNVRLIAAMLIPKPCVVAHNLCCLVMEQCELGIEPIFWASDNEPQEVLRMPMTVPA